MEKNKNTIYAKDYDTWYSENMGLPSALYFYMLDKNFNGWDSEMMSVLGNCPSIVSLQLTPFLSFTDVEMYHTPYDYERFGKFNELNPSLEFAPSVFRITGMNTDIKTLGNFRCYKPKKSIGGKTHWQNESRLYNYPYAFAMLTDNLNPPLEIKYHLCKDNDNYIKVRNTISDRCSYGLFIENYKNDKNGMMESLVSGDSHELPCSSSAYSQWFASNKNQVAQNTYNMVQESYMKKAQVRRGALPRLIGSVGGGIISSGANMINTMNDMKNFNETTNFNVKANIDNVMAMTQDLNNTPRTITSMGSDFYYGYAKGDKSLTLHRFGLTLDYYIRLGDYFMRYGYMQNKIMYPNINSRYYFNYIKTIGMNLSGFGIPRNHMEELKSIFDNGVTVWHVDQPGVVVGDFSNDNYEI